MYDDKTEDGRRKNEKERADSLTTGNKAAHGIPISLLATIQFLRFGRHWKRNSSFFVFENKFVDSARALVQYPKTIMTFNIYIMGVLNVTCRVGYALILRDLLRRRELECLQNITHYFSINFYGCVLRQLASSNKDRTRKCVHIDPDFSF